MKRTRIFILAFFFLLCVQLHRGTSLVSAETADETFGRACLLVEESLSGDEALIPSISAFDQSSQPGSGKRLLLQIDASRNCFVLAVAFEPDETLAYDWRPELVQVAAWEEATLPRTPGAWD